MYYLSGMREIGLIQAQAVRRALPADESEEQGLEALRRPSRSLAMRCGLVTPEQISQYARIRLRKFRRMRNQETRLHDYDWSWKPGVEVDQLTWAAPLARADRPNSIPMRFETIAATDRSRQHAVVHPADLAVGCIRPKRR